MSSGLEVTDEVFQSARQHRLRPGREPAAHHQGDPRRHPRLTNAAERGRRPDTGVGHDRSSRHPAGSRRTTGERPAAGSGPPVRPAGGDGADRRQHHRRRHLQPADLAGVLRSDHARSRWRLTTVGALALALLFAALSRRLPADGGPYAYARVAFGNRSGSPTPGPTGSPPGPATPRSPSAGSCTSSTSSTRTTTGCSPCCSFWSGCGSRPRSTCPA